MGLQTSSGCQESRLVGILWAGRASYGVATMAPAGWQDARDPDQKKIVAVTVAE